MVTSQQDSSQRHSLDTTAPTISHIEQETTNNQYQHDCGVSDRTRDDEEAGFHSISIDKQQGTA
jgi:hypothetical protein